MFIIFETQMEFFILFCLKIFFNFNHNICSLSIHQIGNSIYNIIHGHFFSDLALININNYTVIDHPLENSLNDSFNSQRSFKL